MYIKNKIKYSLVFLFVSTLITGEYFSFSGITEEKNLILLCNDNIYYPMLFTGHNMGLQTNIDIKIPTNRTPNIKTQYNSKHSIYLDLKNTTIKYNNSKDYYLKNR